ncbi:MAG: hypothetical protein HYX96_08410 [Chloroflexi bacterium]|nr:hypothetical protein [Chloroflexota bacterium]
MWELGKVEQDESRDIEKRWRRTARSRLKFELAGLALASKAGMSPEEYAGFLWSRGASKWLGEAAPSAARYILKEAEAFRALCPEVEFELGPLAEDAAYLTFTRGCLGGWGKERWGMASSLGLGREDVCRYCREAFRVWAAEVGLEAGTEPQPDGKCVLRAGLPNDDKSRIAAPPRRPNIDIGTSKEGMS